MGRILQRVSRANVSLKVRASATSASSLAARSVRRRARGTSRRRAASRLSAWHLAAGLLLMGRALACGPSQRTPAPLSPWPTARLPLRPSPGARLPRGAVQRLGPPPGSWARAGDLVTRLSHRRIAVITGAAAWVAPWRPGTPTSVSHRATPRRGEVRIWERGPDPTAPPRLRWLVAAVDSWIAYSRDTQRAALLRRGPGGNLWYEVWDLRSLRRLWRAAARPTENWHARGVLLSRDGRTVLVAGAGRTVRWYRLPDGASLGQLVLGRIPPFPELVALSPDGRYLFARGALGVHGVVRPPDSATHAFDLATGARIVLPGHGRARRPPRPRQAPVLRALRQVMEHRALSRRAGCAPLASGAARLRGTWVSTGCPARLAPVWVGVGPRGKIWLQGRRGGRSEWRWWDPLRGRVAHRAAWPRWARPARSTEPDPVVAHSPGWRFVAVARAASGGVVVYAMRQGRVVARLGLPTPGQGGRSRGAGVLDRVALSRGARWVAVSSYQVYEDEPRPGVLRVVPRRSGRPLDLWRALFVSAPVFDPAGARVAIAARGEARVFTLPHGRLAERAPYAGTLHGLSLDATGRLLAVLERPPMRYGLYQLRPAGARRLLSLPSGVGVSPLAFTPARRYLITSHRGGAVILWRIPPGSRPGE